MCIKCVCVAACVSVCVCTGHYLLYCTPAVYAQVFGCLCEWPSRDTADASADMCRHGNTQVSEGRMWYARNSLSLALS